MYRVIITEQTKKDLEWIKDQYSISTNKKAIEFLVQQRKEDTKIISNLTNQIHVLKYKHIKSRVL